MAKQTKRSWLNERYTLVDKKPFADYSKLPNLYFLLRSSLSSHLNIIVLFLLLGAQRLTQLHESVPGCTNPNNPVVLATENAKPPLRLPLPRMRILLRAFLTLGTSPEALFCSSEIVNVGRLIIN